MHTRGVYHARADILDAKASVSVCRHLQVDLLRQLLKLFLQHQALALYSDGFGSVISQALMPMVAAICKHSMAVLLAVSAGHRANQVAGLPD